MGGGEDEKGDSADLRKQSAAAGLERRSANALTNLLKRALALHEKVQALRSDLPGKDFRAWRLFLKEHARELSARIAILAPHDAVPPPGVRRARPQRRIDRKKCRENAAKKLDQLCEEYTKFIAAMRKTHRICDEKRVFAATQFLDVWGDETEQRMQRLFRAHQCRGTKTYKIVKPPPPERFRITMDQAREYARLSLPQFVVTKADKDNVSEEYYKTWQALNFSAPDAADGPFGPGWRGTVLNLYDVEGRHLFRDLAASLPKGKELRVRTAASENLGAPVLSVGIHRPLPIETWIKRARRVAKKKNLTPVPGERAVVCYSYPDTGLLCLAEDGKRWVIDFVDEAAYPINGNGRAVIRKTRKKSARGAKSRRRGH